MKTNLIFSIVCFATFLALSLAQPGVVATNEILPGDTLTNNPPVIDNCAHLPHACSSHATCIYELSGWACKCNQGFTGDGYTCTDVDECSPPNPFPCDTHASCVNTEGGYICNCDEGYEGDGKTCIKATKGVFPAVIQEEDEPTEDDKSTEGLFLELRGGEVYEINQLQAKSYVDPGWAARRKGGGLVEAEVYYEIPAEMNAGQVGTYIIKYQAVDVEDDTKQSESRQRIVNVVDVDECELGIHTCSMHANCVNTNGSYLCQCKSGFTGDGFKCTDINECRLGLADCHKHADCTNTQGSYICTCHEGYEGDGKICTNIDECKSPSLNKCDPHAECTDTEGSYECKCRDGFQGNGFVCEPVDSCTHQRHDCHAHATCIKSDTPEGYTCICNKGFIGNGKECVDLDECSFPDRYTCPEHSHCINHEGGYECNCDKGFEKADDGYSCVDIDECLREIDDCDPHANCTNTEGSFDCTCKEGYTGDGKKCTPLAGVPDIELRGENPKVMFQCDPYREEGFTISDTKKEALRVSVAVPPALMEDPVMQVGTYQIRYIVTDGSQHKSVELRNVTVEKVNRCELPIGHKCRHKCHTWSKCIPTESYPYYNCICAEGFSTTVDEEGNSQCKDIDPPTLLLQGDEVVVLKGCRVCNFIDSGESYDEKKHGGYHAFDSLPDGRQINLDSYVTIRNETVVPNKEWKIFYDVSDHAGNAAKTRVRVVKKEVEDVLQRIENIEGFLNKKFSEFEPYGKKMDILTTYTFLIVKVLGVVLGLVLVVYFVPRLINMFRVMYVQENPSFEEYGDAYDLWYALTRPWMKNNERSRRIQIQYQRQFRDK